MPILSMFYGIIIRMYFFDDKQHHEPHIHVEYADSQAVISVPEGNVLAGELPANKLKLVRAWIEIHQDELIANWKLAVRGNELRMLRRSKNLPQSHRGNRENQMFIDSKTTLRSKNAENVDVNSAFSVSLWQNA